MLVKGWEWERGRGATLVVGSWSGISISIISTPTRTLLHGTSIVYGLSVDLVNLGQVIVWFSPQSLYTVYCGLPEVNLGFNKDPAKPGNSGNSVKPSTLIASLF